MEGVDVEVALILVEEMQKIHVERDGEERLKRPIWFFLFWNEMGEVTVVCTGVEGRDGVLRGFFIQIF